MPSTSALWKMFIDQAGGLASDMVITVGKKTLTGKVDIGSDVEKISGRLDRLLNLYSLDRRVLVLDHTSMFATTIMWMMIKYLMDEWKYDFTHAAAILNVWSGILLILPLFLIHVVDIPSSAGHFYMLALSAIIYTIGLGIFSLSTPPMSCHVKFEVQHCTEGKQKGYLYFGLVLTVLGMAGQATSMGKFMKEQFSQVNENDLCCRSCSWLCFTKHIYVTTVLIVAILIYFEKINSWKIIFILASTFMAIATLLFLSGITEYKVTEASHNNPVEKILRVFVASTLKISYYLPRDEGLYYHDPKEEEKLYRTRGCILRCLDKAAILPRNAESVDRERKRWRLATVTEVETTKAWLCILPLWLTFITTGVVSSIGDTYFIAQADHLIHKLGHLKIPLVTLLGFQKLGELLLYKIYCWSISKCFQNSINNKRYQGMTGIAIAMVFSIVTCIVASKVEVQRLSVVYKNGLVDKPNARIPMNIFWLVPQFILLGGLDGFLKKSNQMLIEQEFIPCLKDYMVLSTDGIRGIGRIGGVLSVYLVGEFLKRRGKPGWFQSTLNHSRLDQYYLLLAIVSSITLGAYIVLALLYSRKQLRLDSKPSDVDHDQESSAFNSMDQAKYCCFQM